MTAPVGNTPMGVIHITTFECITIALGAATLLATVVSCVLSIWDRIDKMKKK